MLKDQIGIYYFEGNYNCAESVVRAANDYYELGLHDRDMKLVAAYGGGIQTGNTCGALLGACAVLSVMYVEQKAHESNDINPVTAKLLEKFETAYHSYLCTDVKPQSFVEGSRCFACVQLTCDALEETIREYEEEIRSIL